MYRDAPWQARITKAVGLFTLYMSLILIVSGCSSQGKMPMVVRIGYEAIVPDYAFFVATERGYFEEQGLQVEAIQFNTTNEQTLALMAGRVDMIPNSSLALLLAAEAEQPGRFQVFMANGDIGSKILVRADSPITSVAELAGRSVGTLPGTTMITYCQLALAPYFVNLTPPTYVGMAPASLIEALTTKQVDAIIVVEPTATVAIRTGVAKEILDNLLGNVITPFVGGATPLRAQLIKDNPKAAAAVVRAMNQAADFIHDRPDEASAILAKYTDFSPDLLKGTQVGSVWKLEEINREAVQALADILFKSGIVPRQIDTKGWYYAPR